MDADEKRILDADKRYPKVLHNRIDDLDVGKKISNTESISASLFHYLVLRGIREIKLSDIQVTDPLELFRSKNDRERVSALAHAILESNRIDPLIVVIDAEGPYVLEGMHRLGALHLLEKKKLPALVVVETSTNVVI